MHTWRVGYAFGSLVLVAAAFAAPVAAAPADLTGSTGRWHPSKGRIPVEGDRAILLKLDDHRLIWIGGEDGDPSDDRRVFVYDVRTERFREVAPLPAAKRATEVGIDFALAGVLGDGSVVVAGSLVTDDADQPRTNVLSYRFLPWANRWVRTGDLPEEQSLIGTATVLLPDGRLLAAGGIGREFVTTGTASTHAFVFDPDRRTRVEELDGSGRGTSREIRVRGTWDYTRTVDGAVSNASEGHLFGNLVRLADGRVLLVGGHRRWPDYDAGVLSTHTDFFDPRTGAWRQGPPLPTVAGEDDRVADSHGGRTNGTCVTALKDGRVLIAGGFTVSDGEPDQADTGRQSMLVMRPAADPARSRFRLLGTRIPSGQRFGGLFAGPGRGHLLCYRLGDGRVLLAGGQSDVGDDLYDTYVYDPATDRIRRGPDLLHGTALWAAQHPEYGYPADYVTGRISTREVAIRNSSLVFGGRTVVHGGAFDGLDYDRTGVPFVEQLTLG